MNKIICKESQLEKVLHRYKNESLSISYDKGLYSMSIPYYCPNCGIPIREDMNDVGENSNRFPIENNKGDGGYDIYCPECEWSGDIYPDDETNKRDR